MLSRLKRAFHSITNIQNIITLKHKNVKCGSGIHIKGHIRIYGRKGNIELGNNFFANSGIRYNPIGGGTIITDTDCHSIVYDDRMQSPDPGIRHKPIHIGKGVFIGTHSIILKGVTIGDYSVVGAGSVVSCNIPAGEIWAGNPAKFVKEVPSEVTHV